MRQIAYGTMSSRNQTLRYGAMYSGEWTAGYSVWTPKHSAMNSSRWVVKYNVVYFGGWKAS